MLRASPLGCRSLLQDECRNYQTKWLCGTGDDCMDASSPTALAAAVRRLHTAYDVVGVVEHMDDSVRLMARRLPKFFPSVDTTSPSALHLNRNPHPPVSALASGLLSAWNSNDLALYVAGTVQVYCCAELCGRADLATR